jgi:uncharacterized membrane protein
MNAWLGLTIPIAVIMVLTGTLLYWMPRLTRPDLYFATTVPADFPDSALGRRILGRYRATLVASSLIALALLAVVGYRGSLVLGGSALIVQDAGCLAAYFRARAQVKPHALAPTTVRDALLSPRPAHLPGGWLVQAGPIVMLSAVALYLNHRWADIPERFPIHWSMDGQPNGWSTRTMAGVYGPLLIAAVICLTLTALAYGVLHRSRPIHPSGRAGEAEAGFRVTVAGILVAAQYLLAAIFGWTAILPLRSIGSGPPVVWGVLVPTLAFVVLTTALLVRKGQGGTRALRDSPDLAADASRQPIGDRTEDRYWKGGFLYVNSQDPALFVEKRFGIGYTLNFGRPGSWIIVAALVLAPVVLALVVRLAGK